MIYQHLLSRVYNQPHLLLPEKLEAIRQVVTGRALGVPVSPEAIEETKAAAARNQEVRAVRSVAILPIVGTLANRIGLMEESSGGVSTQRIGRQLEQLVADESVGAIILEFDSPGGESFGVQELAAKIFEARSRKPIEAIANATIASGAFWLAEAAQSVSITPSGWIGSHGVYMVHTDLSVWNESEGVKVSYISAGPHKVEMASEMPLSDDARAYYQSVVDGIYDEFTRDLARFRGTTTAQVKANFGGGRMLRPKDAKAAGMVDRIETLEEMIARMAGNKPAKKAGSRATLDRERLALEEFRS